MYTPPLLLSMENLIRHRDSPQYILDLQSVYFSDLDVFFILKNEQRCCSVLVV